MTEIVKKDQGGLVKYTPAKLLIDYSPEKINQQCSSLVKVKDVIAADSNSISVFRKDLGAQAIIDVIVLHLVSLCQAINVHKTLNGPQIKDLALEISSSFHFLSIVEIAHVFRCAKRGDYGSFKFALNMGDVIGWFKQYQEQRISEFIKNSEEIHRQRKNGTQVVYDEESGESKIFQTKEFHELQVKALSEFKKRMPQDTSEEDYQDFKQELDAGNVQFVDQSNNEELNEMKKRLEQQYGIK